MVMYKYGKVKLSDFSSGIYVGHTVYCLCLRKMELYIYCSGNALYAHILW